MSKIISDIPAKILVSACLLGKKTRYDGDHNRLDNPILNTWKQEDRIISVCPEIEGGCPIPRALAECIDGDGTSVVAGKTKVVNIEGQDVTKEFLLGAQKALQIVQQNDISVALLKARSPSCGSNFVYNGTFSNTLKPGKGVTTALLKLNGIRVFNEDEIEEADEYLRGFD